MSSVLFNLVEFQEMMEMKNSESSPQATAAKAPWAPTMAASVLAIAGLAVGGNAALDPWVSGTLLLLVTMVVMRVITRPSTAAATGANEAGQAPLVGEVLPVWHRHIDSARVHSEEAIGGI